jgi:sialate O-acetylesterase
MAIFPFTRVSLSLLFLVLAAVSLSADVRMPGLFGNHMVLQQDTKIPVWGWADAGEDVTVSLGADTAKTTADSDGQWRVDLDPVKTASTPFTLTVTGKNSLTFSDVLVGDVWICSGQSNMEFSFKWGIPNSATEIPKADEPQLRLFTVARNISAEPVTDVHGEWKVCSPTTVVDFSLVGYYFGRELSDSLKRPIGLISAPWSGVPAQSFISLSALQKNPPFPNYISHFQYMAADYSPSSAITGNRTGKNWGHRGGWNDATLNAYPDWLEIDFSGSKTISEIDVFTLEDGDPVTPTLTTTFTKSGITAFDVQYWNGSAWTNVPNGSVTGNNNVWRQFTFSSIPTSKIRVVVNNALNSYSRITDLEAWTPADGETPATNVALAANGATASASSTFTHPNGPYVEPSTPTVLYNGMIAPLIPYAIKGVIWYQGESNGGPIPYEQGMLFADESNAYKGGEYQTLFPRLISDWRERWNQGDFPFLYVQLASYTKPQVNPSEGGWAYLREAQLKTLALPNTGMAVIIDIGDANTIHPKDKLDVGLRLALAAKHVAYGQDIVYSGPIYDSMTVEGNKIRLTFKDTGSGLQMSVPPWTSSGTPAPVPTELTGFAIAGADKNWVWAKAQIDGNTVLVSSDQVASPVAVRYGWANNPPCNLYNKEGLPASPFRTDDWP